MSTRFAPLAVGVFLLSAALHLVAFLQFRGLPAGAAASPGLAAIVAALFAASLAFSAAMLSVRQRFPFRVLLVLRVAILVALGCTSASSRAVPALLLALLGETAFYEAWPANLVLCLLIAAASLLLQGPDRLAYALFGSAVAAAASLAGRYREVTVRDRREIETLQNAVEELTRASRGYMDFASSAERRSMIEERNRITRELHDTIGYTFTNLIMTMEAVTDLAEKDPARLRQTVQAGREQAERGLAEVRRALYLLREQQTRREAGLAAILKLVRLFESATQVVVNVQFGNAPQRCGDEIDTALYHLVQEGLTNSFRHGRATRIDLLFWSVDGSLRVTMRDNGSGPGPGPAAEGIGIRGMRERLGKLGGTLEAAGYPGGFKIEAEVPLASEPISPTRST